MSHMNNKYMLLPLGIIVCLLGACVTKPPGIHFSNPSVLSGTWTSNSITLNSRGKNTTNKRLVLEFTDEGTVTGTASWALLSGSGGHDLDTASDHDSERLIGSFNPHDGVFFLVETEENGFWYCRALTEDLIHCHLVQPGPKHVSTFVVFNRNSQ